MREITKLIREIPIDELTGENESFEMSSIIYDEKNAQNKGAKVRTHKMGTGIMVAAAMALMIGAGAFAAVRLHDKVTPSSYLHKNNEDMNVSADVENRTLIEQYITHMGGDPDIIRDRLVVFDELIAPENYLIKDMTDIDEDVDYDFQILGYTYSGDIADLYYCYEDPDSVRKNQYKKLSAQVSEKQARLKKEIDEAQAQGDDDKLRQLTDESYELEAQLYDESEIDEKYKFLEKLYDVGFEISSGGEVILNSPLISVYDRIGDYDVSYVSIDMTKVRDKKVILSASFDDHKCDDLEIDLGGYKKTSDTVDIQCDVNIVSAPTYGDDKGSLLRRPAEYTVKRITADKGFVKIYTESQDSIDASVFSPSGVYSEDGGLLSFNGFAGVVYDNDTSPVHLKMITNTCEEIKNNDGSKVTVFTFDTQSTPIETDRIKYFIIDNRRIYINNDDAPQGETACYKYPSNDENMYFFKADIEKVSEYLEKIKKEGTELDADKYDVYYPQGKMITIYKDDKEIKNVCVRVNVSDSVKDDDGSNRLDDAHGEKLLYIDGKHYKLTDKELEKYNQLCYQIATKTPKGEEK
ncbi:MAG: hypothetical protein IJ696_07060 [Ruminococcus sp.]|nr:hypothetical protein [Ruminococcus sp.]